MAMSYARLLPMRLVSCRIVAREDAQSRLAVEGDPSVPGRAALPPRIEIPDDLRDALAARAALTYVPASEASRSAGAGAGNIDND